MTTPSPVVLAPLRESTVVLLMAQRQRDDETLDAVIARLARDGSLPNGMSAIATPSRPVSLKVAKACPQREGKYGLELLGETLRADTLAGLFGALIDRLAELDQKAVEKLSTVRAATRGFVSREKSKIHSGRPDLPLLKTRSGWWTSANIGTDDLERALKRTCEVNDLVYGRDICFLGR